MNVKWAENTWEEIRDYAGRGAVVVAPFGSTEQHGPMLPLDTDIHIAERLAQSGAEEAWERFQIPALVLPVMPVGLALHHLGFAGTLSLQPETYIAAVADVLGCVIEHGFPRIAMVSGHGGNMPGLRLAAEKLVCKYAGQKTLRIALFQGHQDPTVRERSRVLFAGEPGEGQPGIHASRWETSETLADRPQLVRREKMVRPAQKVAEVPEWTWRTEDLTETGAFGDPSQAYAAAGGQMWAMWAEAVALFVKRLWEAPVN